MTKIDQQLLDDIDLLVISHMILKVMSGEKIDVDSYYFKYYMNVVIFKIGVPNIKNMVIPKELYKYINGYDVKYNLLHEDGIDTIKLEPNILKKMLSNIKGYYFNDCVMNFPAPMEYDYGAYFDEMRKTYRSKFETVVRSVDCVEDNLKLEFLEIDLAKSIKVEDYRLSAKIKKEIDKLKNITND